MRSVELFSGCGGLALGTARAGFKHALMVEWNDDACDTLAWNKRLGVEHAKHWPVRKGDVRDIDWTVIGSAGLVAGGPPCQPFSIGGKHRGNEDARDMWPEAVRAVRELAPSAFLFENVRGLARPAFAEYLEWITAHLSTPSLERRAGEDHAAHLARLRRATSRVEYDVRVLKVNAADYGAAQKRNRVVIAGIRRQLGFELGDFAPTHSREKLLWDQWITGEYWKRHGLKAKGREPQNDGDRKLVALLRGRLLAPAGQPWRTVRDALFGLGRMVREITFFKLGPASIRVILAAHWTNRPRR